MPAYLLIEMDYLSRFVETYSTLNEEVTTATEILIKVYISWVGMLLEQVQKINGIIGNSLSISI